MIERFRADGWTESELYAYNYSFRDDYTDEEIARGFEMAKALGVKILTASSTLSVVDRVDREASKNKIRVGFHGHSDTKHPNEFSSPETFEKAARMGLGVLCFTGSPG